jgi:acetyltransferase-like isoleucine patch superfamily enzyme
MRSLLKRIWKKTNSHSVRKLLSLFYKVIGRNHIHIHGDKNRLIINDSLLLNIEVDVIGSNIFIEFGEGCQLSNTLIRIRGNNHKIVIGKQCSYQGGQLWIEDHDCALTIGNHTTVVEAKIGVTEPGSMITIGEECMFAHGIELRCGDSHSIIDLETGKRINYAKDIYIGKHVWFASDVMVLKGVCIGDDSVVASRALVTKSFPANSLIGGVPASVMKENITWNRQRIDDRKDQQ